VLDLLVDRIGAKRRTPWPVVLCPISHREDGAVGKDGQTGRVEVDKDRLPRFGEICPGAHHRQPGVPKSLDRVEETLLAPVHAVIARPGDDRKPGLFQRVCRLRMGAIGVASLG